MGCPCSFVLGLTTLDSLPILFDPLVVPRPTRRSRPRAATAHFPASLRSRTAIAVAPSERLGHQAVHELGESARIVELPAFGEHRLTE